MKNCKSSGRYGFGIVVLLTGLVLLGGNLGVIPPDIYDVIISWPMILIAIALVSFINGEFIGGLILSLIGGYFMAVSHIDNFSAHNIWRFWPVLLILLGFAIIKGKKPKKPAMVYHSNSEDLIDEVAIFGGNVTRIESKRFKGGSITSIFGGSEVNFVDAALSDEGAVIEMTAIFGGVKLIVPRDWHIKIEVASVLGGFTDKRVPGSDLGDKSKVLIIKGVTIFGGGELLSY